jgi:hypothetical protein
MWQAPESSIALYCLATGEEGDDGGGLEEEVEEKVEEELGEEGVPVVAVVAITPYRSLPSSR